MHETLVHKVNDGNSEANSYQLSLIWQALGSKPEFWERLAQTIGNPGSFLAPSIPPMRTKALISLALLLLKLERPWQRRVAGLPPERTAAAREREREKTLES